MELYIKNLEKRYGEDFWAVQQMNLRLSSGVIGLLGPNGAGKSSLMRILATISKPTVGTVIWNETDIVKRPDQLREVLGYLPQDFGVYPNLNAIEFLNYIAALKGITGKSAHRRIDELIQLMNLNQVCKSPLGGYSGGMKQRVGIAQALLNDPKLLIVDEPTVGLDPEERVRFRNLLSDMSGERMIIFSTHIVSDIESTATKIAVMKTGKLLTYTCPEDMLQAIEGKVWEMTVGANEITEIKQKWLVSGTIRRVDGIQIRVVHDEAPMLHAKLVSPTLEDAYLHMIASSEKVKI